MIYYWGATDQGAVRSQNQDAFYFDLLDKQLLLAIVCDGMGGANAGDVASKLAIESMADYLKKQTISDIMLKPHEILGEAASYANKNIYAAAASEETYRGMGTTLVSALITSQKAFILNIGDSRAYLVRNDEILPLTRDHSYVEELVLRGEISPEEARHHPRKNLITRCLGAEISAKPDFYEITLKPRYRLLLCTDGLTNALSDEEILHVIQRCEENGEAPCRRLIEEALTQGATDNVTAAFVQIG